MTKRRRNFVKRGSWKPVAGKIKCSRCLAWKTARYIKRISDRPVCRACAKESSENRYGSREVYKPSPEKIAEECRKIREGETEEQLMRRAGMEVGRVEILAVHVPPKLADKVMERRIGRHGI